MTPPEDPYTTPFQDFMSGQGSWEDLVLGEMPQATYRSSPTGMAYGQKSPSQQRFFQNAYQDVYSDYLGQLGQSLRAGQNPMAFMDYLETDPWTKRYAALPQTARGKTGAYSSPRTRYLYNF